MSGYFTKNNGYVFNGEHPLAASAVAGIKNGLFVEIGAGGTVFPTVVAGYEFLAVEITEHKGEVAARMDVVAVGANPLYMVEQVAISSDQLDDNGDMIIKIGELVRARRPQLGDQMVINLPKTLTVVAGDTLIPVIATGVLAKKA